MKRMSSRPILPTAAPSASVRVPAHELVHDCDDPLDLLVARLAVALVLDRAEHDARLLGDVLPPTAGRRTTRFTVCGSGRSRSS